jgi:hypothetical protein
VVAPSPLNERKTQQKQLKQHLNQGGERALNRSQPNCGSIKLASIANSTMNNNLN